MGEHLPPLGIGVLQIFVWRTPMTIQNKAKLLRKYRNLSRVLTTNNNMDITFSGTQAYHVPGRINLPIGDFSDDDFITMSMGFCDHELGHENYTNSHWYHEAANRSPYLKGLLNALDDYHQERRLIADFRGTRLTLRKLVELCKEKGIFRVLPDEAPVPMYVQAWVLFKVRSYLEQPVSDIFNDTDKRVLSIFGPKFYTDIHSLLSTEVIDGLVSTEHCFNAAESIFQLLIDWIEDNKAEPDDSDSQSDSSDSDDSDSQDDSSDPDDSDSQSDSSDSDDSDSQDDSRDSDDSESQGDSSDSDDSDSQDDSSDPDDSDSQSDSSDSDDSDSQDDSRDSDDSDSQGDSSDSGDSGSSRTTSNTTDDKKLSNEEVEAIIQALDEYDDDFHDKLISSIEEMAEQHPIGQIISLPIAKNENSLPLSSDRLIDDNLRGIISRIKNPLKRIFHDQNYVNNSLHNRGKSISSSRLASVVIGNTKVFDSQAIHRSPNAAIALLIDKSGSMDDSDMKMANSVAYSLSTALDGIHGVESLVAYYPLRDQDYVEHLAIVKSFEEKSSIQSFNIGSFGGTPTAEAIQSATSLLMTRGEPRKLLFVITDGDPNSVKDTELAIEEAQALGVKVFGIGIRQVVSGFKDTDFHVIDSTKELVNALTVGLKHAFK